MTVRFIPSYVCLIIEVCSRCKSLYKYCLYRLKGYGLKPYPPSFGENSTQNCIQLLMRYTLYAYHIKRQNKTNILKGGCFKQPRHGHTLNMVVLFRHTLLFVVWFCILFYFRELLHSFNGFVLP